MATEDLHGIDSLETPERVDLTVDLAGVGSRTVAFILDWILLVVFTLVALLAIIAGGFAIEWRTATVILVYLLTFTAWWLYFALFEGLWDGQTPGKRTLGLRVRKVGGYPIGWPEALIRNFLRMLVDLFLFGVPLGLLIMVLGRRNQRIGDLAAGTVVVRERTRSLQRLATIGFDSSEAVAASAHVDLTTEEFEILHDYLERRLEIHPDSRKRIKIALATALRERLGRRGSMRTEWTTLTDGVFLVFVDAAYRGVEPPPGGSTHSLGGDA